MKIIFSRHARRRLKLYRIEEKDVVSAIESSSKQKHASSEERIWVVDKSLAVNYLYPIKVVFVQEHGRIVVVTAYPVKKGKQS